MCLVWVYVGIKHMKNSGWFKISASWTRKFPEHTLASICWGGECKRWVGAIRCVTILLIWPPKLFPNGMLLTRASLTPRVWINAKSSLCCIQITSDVIKITIRNLHGWLIEAERRIYASVNLPSLLQVMACRLVGAKPLSETMLEYFQLDP